MRYYHDYDEETAAWVVVDSGKDGNGFKCVSSYASEYEARLDADERNSARKGSVESYDPSFSRNQ